MMHLSRSYSERKGPGLICKTYTAPCMRQTDSINHTLTQKLSFEFISELQLNSHVQIKCTEWLNL